MVIWQNLLTKQSTLIWGETVMYVMRLLDDSEVDTTEISVKDVRVPADAVRQSYVSIVVGCVETVGRC